MSFIEVVGTGFLLLVISAASILLVSALQGAGKPIGEAGLVEIAPWIARAVPRVLVRLALLGRKDLVTDIDLEVQTLVDETFAELGDSPNARARGLIRSLGQSLSLVTRARSMRQIPQSKQVAGTALMPRVSPSIPFLSSEVIAKADFLDGNGRVVIRGGQRMIRAVREYSPGPLPEISLDEIDDADPYVLADDPELGIIIDPDSPLGRKFTDMWQRIQDAPNLDVNVD